MMNNTKEELPHEGRSSYGGDASWEGLNPDPFLLWWLALFIEALALFPNIEQEGMPQRPI